MMNPRNAFLAAVATSLIAGTGARRVHAQSAQVYSLQGSGLTTSLRFNGSDASGAGFEVQLRHNQLKDFSAGVFSLGFGYQSTKHKPLGTEFEINGLFLEPRIAFALGSN